MKLHSCKVENLDVSIIPLFANPVTYCINAIQCDVDDLNAELTKEQKQFFDSDRILYYCCMQNKQHTAVCSKAIDNMVLIRIVESPLLFTSKLYIIQHDFDNTHTHTQSKAKSLAAA